jgi:O-antigen/teichoic acid export membrane protein
MREPAPASAGRHLVDGAVRSFLAEALFPLTGLVTSAVLSRGVGLAGYGRFALAAMLISSIEWALTALLSRATIKAVGETDDWEPAASAALRLHLGVSLAAGAAMMAAASPLAALFGEPALAGELRLYALDIPLFGLAQAHGNVMIARRMFRERARTRAARWISRLVLIVGLVWSGFSVAGAILGSVGATLVELAIGRVFVKPRLATAGAPLPHARLWGYALPLFFSGLGLRVFGLDLMALKALGAPAADAGLYGAALSLSMVPNLLALAVSPALLATLVRLRAEAHPEEARRLGREALRGAVLLAPFAAAALGARDGIVRLVFGSAFAGAARLLPALVGAGLALLFTTFAIAILTAAGRARLTAWLTLPMPLATLAGCALAVPRFGALGAALATGAASAGGAAAALVATGRVTGVTPPMASFARALVASAAGFLVSAALPGAGLFVLLRLAAGCVVALATLAGLGEWPRDERVRLLSALRSAA